jgi:hypothetical protein
VRILERSRALAQSPSGRDEARPPSWSCGFDSRHRHPLHPNDQVRWPTDPVTLVTRSHPPGLRAIHRHGRPLARPRLGPGGSAISAAKSASTRRRRTRSARQAHPGYKTSRRHAHGRTRSSAVTPVYFMVEVGGSTPPLATPLDLQLLPASSGVTAVPNASTSGPRRERMRQTENEDTHGSKTEIPRRLGASAPWRTGGSHRPVGHLDFADGDPSADRLRGASAGRSRQNQACHGPPTVPL